MKGVIMKLLIKISPVIAVQPQKGLNLVTETSICLQLAYIMEDLLHICILFK